MRRALTFLAAFFLASSTCASSKANTAQISGTSAVIANSPSSSMDPSDIVNTQFAAVPAITCDSSSSKVVQWLARLDEIFTRVATGGLSSLPPNGLAAVKTMETEIAETPSRINDARVLKKLLHVLPSLWNIGFWYKPVSVWKDGFGCIFTRAVAAAKTLDDKICYDAAVNATSLMIRFIKDQVFFDGEDHGDAVELQGQNKDYLAYLPELVVLVSKNSSFTLTEKQLRAFMATKMPSKTDGMDTAAAFPVFVDTSKYQASDAAALAKFLSGGFVHSMKFRAQTGAD